MIFNKLAIFTLLSILFSFSVKATVIQEQHSILLGQDFLELVQKKGYSMFHLISDEVYERGLRQLQLALQSEDIKARNDNVLSDTLDMVPGISITKHRKGNMQFYLRGYDMEYVAILVDGIPVTDALSKSPDRLTEMILLAFPALRKKMTTGVR